MAKITRKDKRLHDEVDEITRELRKTRGLPMVERIESLNRVIATMLCKEGIPLPSYLKRFVSH